MAGSSTTSINISQDEFLGLLACVRKPMEAVLGRIEEQQRLSSEVGCVVGISPFLLLQLMLAISQGAGAVGPGWMTRITETLEAAAQFDAEMEAVFSVWKSFFVPADPAETTADKPATEALPV
jgi:hypothetical protein